MVFWFHKGLCATLPAGWGRRGAIRCTLFRSMTSVCFGARRRRRRRRRRSVCVCVLVCFLFRVFGPPLKETLRLIGIRHSLTASTTTALMGLSLAAAAANLRSLACDWAGFVRVANEACACLWWGGAASGGCRCVVWCECVCVCVCVFCGV